MTQEELYKTKSASIAQCDRTESFLLKFDDQVVQLKLCDLYLLRNKIKRIDLISLFDVESPEVEIIHLPHCDRFLVLSIKEILEFRELLNGTFNILALNSAVSKILRRHIFNF